MEPENFYRDTWVEIDLDCIYTNVERIKKHVPIGVEVIAVVKANAYGHGDIQVAKVAVEAGATSLAVAFLDEALHLRKAGIEVPIIVMGVIRPRDIDVAVNHSISVTVFQQEWLVAAQKYKKTKEPLLVHVKFDTGMGRIGIRTEKEWGACVPFLLHEDFQVEGVFTHFATADELNDEHFNFQYNAFLRMMKWVERDGISPKIIHCANSAASFRFSAHVFNAVRIGIGMYGLTPAEEMTDMIPIDINPAFSFHSKITHIKELHMGDTVSYGATYVAKENEWVATVPVGYADGWIRRLQGFHVLVNGEEVPIIGRICMDQFMIRLPREVPIDTQVTLIGKQGKGEVSVESVARYLGTINYEIICTISARVPRVFIKNGEMIETFSRFSSDVE